MPDRSNELLVLRRKPRIIRNGTPYGFWRPQVAELEAGDILMEICPTCE